MNFLSFKSTNSGDAKIFTTKSLKLFAWKICYFYISNILLARDVVFNWLLIGQSHSVIANVKEKLVCLVIMIVRWQEIVARVPSVKVSLQVKFIRNNKSHGGAQLFHPRNKFHSNSQLVSALYVPILLQVHFFITPAALLL